jgi:hypothetical protein
MKPRILRFLWICLLSTGALSANAADPNALRNPSPAPNEDMLHNPLWNARIDSIDLDHSSLLLVDCPSREIGGKWVECRENTISCLMKDDAKQQLKTVHLGDHAKVLFETDKMDMVRSISPRQQAVGLGQRIFVIVLAYLATFLIATLLTRGHPIRLIIGTDNRYSNSKFQMAVWFSILVATYLATIILRLHSLGWDFWGNVNIPAHLLALSGASALTYGAAKGITTSKVEAALAAGNPNPKPSGTPHFFLDLVSNDLGNFDLGDFQMLVITMLAVGMYLVAIFHFLGTIEGLKTVSLPDVDTTILAAFGLGQGAYLTKKAAGNPGTS